MHVVFERADDARLIAHLREAEVTTEVVGWNPERCVQHLLAALEGAELEGYGECFWPEPTGQYWWMFKREDQHLEVAVLWSRSSAVGWQHVFRGTDEISYIIDLIRGELRKSGL
jgi:hypothetical protein